MKKKIAAILLMLMLVLSCAAVLASCDNQKDNSQSGLTYGKKYIYERAINVDDPETVIEYKFNADGTGTFYYKDITKGYDNLTIIEYTITFKYVFVDDDNSAVACFFHEAENKSRKAERTGMDENYNYIYSQFTTPYNLELSDWSRLVSVSKNVLAETLTTGIRKYVNEDYAKTLTNFNKPTDNENK